MEGSESRAREQLRALGDVLRAMTGAGKEIGPVFATILGHAERLCRAENGVIALLRDGELEVVASTASAEPLQVGRRLPLDRSRAGPRAVMSGRTEVVLPGDPEVSQPGPPIRLGVPIKLEGRVIGSLGLVRQTPVPFTASEIELVEAFADQAAIAIENVRLFNETKEALAQQTAVADVLAAISRSAFDLDTVLSTIVERAAALCRADTGNLRRIDGDELVVVAGYGPVLSERGALGSRLPLDGPTLASRSVRELQTLSADDVSARPDLPQDGPQSRLAVPILRDGKALGTLVLSNQEVRPFTEREIRLVEVFADQAGIAIENVRLFNETREALEQQTAVSDVLATISRSAFDLPTVLQTIAERAVDLAGADAALIFRVDGPDLVVAARHPAGYSEYSEGFLQIGGRQPTDGATLPARAVRTLSPHYAEDVRHDPSLPQSGTRTRFAVPIQRDGQALGAIVVTRIEVAPFTARQRALVETFADQAAIAIENVRLFNETKEALERQTAISAVLGTISRSAFDLGAILDTVVQNAVRLCGARGGLIFRRDGEVYRFAAVHGSTPSFAKYFQEGHFPPIRPGRGTLTGRVVVSKKPEHVLDLTTDSDYEYGEVNMMEGTRTSLGVPLLHQGEPIGAMSLWRNEVRAFSEGEIELVQTFADQAAIAIENVRLFNETKEALERQTATSEVLRLIAGSPADVQPVLDGIARSAARFCAAENVTVALLQDGRLHGAAAHGPLPGQRERIWVADRSSVSGRAVVDGRTVHVVDLLAESDDEYATGKAIARRFGHRTVLATPLLREGSAIGALLLRRDEVHAFSPQQIELVKTFAAQAVIAIENVRLFNETKEALEQQTALSEILRVISRSPTDVGPVLLSVVENAVRLSGAASGSVVRIDDGIGATAASIGQTEETEASVREFYRTHPIVAGRGSLAGRVLLERRSVQIADVAADPDYESPQMDLALALLGVPLVRRDEIIGVIVLRREAAQAFTAQQVKLVEAFADQAVIAIENVRLFNETREALERQTATANVLEVISRSSDDIQPMLDVVVESAVRLTGADSAAIYRLDGDVLTAIAVHRPLSTRLGDVIPLAARSYAAAVAREGRTVHVPDVRLVPSHSQDEPLTRLGVPIVTARGVFGVIVLGHRAVQPFTPRQIELIETFAAQAAIAIENVRLFNETKEALAQQTSVADVLKTISRSAFDLDRVLAAVVENAARLANAQSGFIFRHDFGSLVHSASYGMPEEIRHLGRDRFAVDRTSLAGRVVLDRGAVEVADAPADPELMEQLGAQQAELGFRTMLGVPIVRDDAVIGVLSLRRNEVRPFSEREIAVVRTFADQAAIAIENVRLFNETKEALDQQTATSEVLQTISRSAFDLQAVLDTVVERAAQLCNAQQAWMRRIEGDRFRLSAYYGASPELRTMFEEMRAQGEYAVIDYSGMGGRAVLERRPIHVHDVTADADLRGASLIIRGGGRTGLAIPMLRDGEPIGAIVIARDRVAPFSDREIRLVETFADQAVIAIENVRLFNEIQDTSRQLERAGRHKSEFLANMSHELRTPLNAIIGFSEVLLQGMFGELNEKQREYQQDVLSSGRHLLTLINDILDLSKIEAGRVDLELAEFSLPNALENGVTMIRERASRHGIRVTVDVEGVDRIVADERKVKQIVLNLLTNAVKFTPDGGSVAVRAARENGEVRVAVRDTGIGIDPADRERIFEEFQQAGRDPERSREGTGLGLALAKRYVELHGGRIWVDSEVGRGSTFTFALPLVDAGKEG